MMMRRVPCTVLFLVLLCCLCSHVYATDDDDGMVRVSAEVLCRSKNASSLWRLTGEREWKVCGPDKNPGSQVAMDEEDPYEMVCNVARPSCMDFNATSNCRNEEEFTFNIQLLTSNTTDLYKRWESIHADADNTRSVNTRNESTAVSSPADNTGTQSEGNADSSDIITVPVHTPPLLLLLLLVTATATAC
ncbi:hypothetical protein TcCL_Unassigned02976 [Trypanosoma cruzi]|uniref:Mucin-like glycoprotein n=1 Tax=Trypanosoma cruzi (strain CL Brener) TaxID=353153 RepID=Q4D2F7_TRYCC|nr:hypothetical protein Tc00.1047053509615.50 [Trypanosoma cruzi]EAN86709.1 hypothetical protein Tc00.1047053509615.50 [Trypanosoma cruzi]RNC34251.1 hypothetical protein TcCL_Unassigned02976 [Trypanosoma cruzi]|eukprot:XP_808560.1 hypothetical protein [Trypanosoma cruzi strain CL Brener]